MEHSQTITELLAKLILGGNVPLRAVALAGEAIAIDARICDYDSGAAKRATLEVWSAFAEAYDVILQRTRSAIEDFSRTRDGEALLLALSEIKERLTAL
jgi:hypothetical protein